MLKVVKSCNDHEWDQLVSSFSQVDIYDMNFYSSALVLGSKSEPLLFYFEGENSRVAFVAIKNDIAESDKFNSIIPKQKYFDLETPYGYGGPLCEGDFTELDKETFASEFRLYCTSENIVSFFIRFNPLTANVYIFEGVSENRFLHNTIYIDTSSPDLIESNMTSKNRNMVRKAQRCDISIERVGLDECDPFLQMYYSTMDRHNADSEYYLFDKKYFEYLKKYGSNHSMLVYAKKDGIPISGSLFFFDRHNMHYHLSGSIYEYRNMAAGNLLLYEVSKLANSMGIKRLHLGGGVSEQDSLFRFKKQFNKNGFLDYYIGRIIFDKRLYSELVSFRKNDDGTFDIDNTFLIQYRA